MCGIVGTFNYPLSTVEQMLARQHSRGPDHTGIEVIGKRGEIMLGHNRLSIVDKSARSNQPVATNGVTLVYNGEIYREPDEFPSDTVALVHDLIDLQPGDLENLLNNLNGMFAFAFHANETITLVRDRFGIKPLYFHHSGDRFAFASTPAAVSLTKSDWEVSKEGLQEYLSLGATMLHSMFEGIVAVPPGHYVTFNCNTHEAKTTRWYYPRFIENALETIEEKVIRAIDRIKLTCDERQIILLSGGVDSTLVGSRFEGQHAIHLRSPEQEYAEQVAKKFNINLITVDPEAHSAEECLRDYVTKSGEPTMAGLIPYITCKEIAKQGFRVAITANGADELFFGYDRMTNGEQVPHIFREFPFTSLCIGPTELGYQYSEIFSDSPSWFEIITYLTHDLNKTLDFASMCHSVEVRVPYLDHELVEAALSIAQADHIGQFGNKTILKRMLRKLGFDWDFIHRPKIGFSLHYQPSDHGSLTEKAMKWYRNSDFPQLPTTATGRQESYHQMTVLGLYMWYKIYKP